MDFKDTNPVISNKQQAIAFFEALSRANPEHLAISQANALAPIWQAIEASDNAQDLTAPRLHRMFTQISQFMHVTQFQRPIITSLDDEFNAIQDQEFAKIPKGNIHLYGQNFGETQLFTDPKTDKSQSYQFTFITAKVNTTPTQKHLYSLPIIRLMPEYFEYATKYANPKMLTSMQDLFGNINHDYIHAATAPIINAYFSDHDQHTLNFADTAFAQAAGQIATAASSAHQQYSMHNETPDKPEALTLAMDNYRAASSPLETHALLAHKELYTNYIEPQSDIVLVKSYFAHLNDLTHLLRQEFDSETATKTSQYFTLLMYERALHMVPYTHPLIKEIEQCATAQPIDKQSWIDLITHATTPTNADNFESSIDKKGTAQFLRNEFSKNAHFEQEPTQRLIRMCAHMKRPVYWSRLHKPMYSAKGQATAIPDLHKVIKSLMSDMKVTQP